MDKTTEILLKRREKLKEEINELMNEYKAIGNVIKENYELKNESNSKEYKEWREKNER